jgi:hypothetical protein
MQPNETPKGSVGLAVVLQGTCKKTIAIGLRKKGRLLGLPAVSYGNTRPCGIQSSPDRPWFTPAAFFFRRETGSACIDGSKQKNVMT